MSMGAAGLAALCALLGLLLYLNRRRAQLVEQRLQDAARSLELLQSSFERFAPREVVEKIIQDGISTEPEKREVTVLFSDLKGFTPMSERLDPAVLVKIVNGYFRAMSRAINAHNGHVSKFIGDGILALFGVPIPNPWQANDAVRAALAMRTALVEYNKKLAAQGLPTLAFGVGIHRGQAVSGVIGSDELMEYTVIGATVNLAFRIEGLTRQHDVDVLITPEVKAALDPRFRLRELPPAPVKGFSAPVVAYAVEGLEEAVERRAGLFALPTPEGPAVTCEL